MLTGLLYLALATAVGATVLGLALYGEDLLRAAATIRGRVVGPSSQPERPDGPPLDRIAGDLRRLQPLVRHPGPGQPMARRRAVQAAYDDALVDACRAVGLPDTLSGLPIGTEREAERLRVEYLLEQAGIQLGDPPHAA